MTGWATTTLLPPSTGCMPAYETMRAPHSTPGTGRAAAFGFRADEDAAAQGSDRVLGAHGCEQATPAECDGSGGGDGSTGGAVAGGCDGSNAADGSHVCRPSSGRTARMASSAASAACHTIALAWSLSARMGWPAGRWRNSSARSRQWLALSGETKSIATLMQQLRLRTWWAQPAGMKTKSPTRCTKRHGRTPYRCASSWRIPLSRYVFWSWSGCAGGGCPARAASSLMNAHSLGVSSRAKMSHTAPSSAASEPTSSSPTAAVAAAALSSGVAADTSWPSSSAGSAAVCECTRRLNASATSQCRHVCPPLA
mmetsp:Transcript_7385/g.18896  ORF Transcript_7385/g.18896 Transcript_7385/m.18896 type:complete len:311 (+) Transcript_7385:80-1012(+)